jgi:hypothetical protein
MTLPSERKLARLTRPNLAMGGWAHTPFRCYSNLVTSSALIHEKVPRFIR